MTIDLFETMAGLVPATASDQQADACLDELKSLIQKFLQAGVPPNAIIAALARSTVFTLDQQKPH